MFVSDKTFVPRFNDHIRRVNDEILDGNDDHHIDDRQHAQHTNREVKSRETVDRSFVLPGYLKEFDCFRKAQG